MILFSGQRSAIGLDLGSRRIKAVQFAHTRRGQQLVAWLDVDRPAGSLDSTWVSRFHGLLDRRGFRGRRVCLAAPASEVQASVVSLPPADDEVARDQVTRMSLARMHRLEAGAFEYAAWPLPSDAGGRGKQQVMSYAYEHVSAERLLDLFEAGGFDVERIEVPSLALLTALGEQLNDEDRLGLTVDLGWSGCRIIAHTAGTIVYERVIESAGLSALYAAIGEGSEGRDDLTHALIQRAQKQGKSSRPDPIVSKAIRQHAGVLAEEIRVCKTYLDRQYRGDHEARVMIVGGGAWLSQLVEVLDQQMEAEVEAPVLSGLPAGQTREVMDPLTLARGLALRSWAVSGVAA